VNSSTFYFDYLVGLIEILDVATTIFIFLVGSLVIYFSIFKLVLCCFYYFFTLFPLVCKVISY